MYEVTSIKEDITIGSFIFLLGVMLLVPVLTIAYFINQFILYVLGVL